MSRLLQGNMLRGVAILIAAIFSGAWTFSVAGIGGVVSAEEQPIAPGGLPDGSSVPSEAIDQPASLSDPDDLTGGNSASVIAASATNAIPAAALAAYQRAETVINKADETCNITWQLIAAIGRVESNHGRVHGNVLSDEPGEEGVATPGIYGPALNGTGGVKAIPDTDGGQYDADAEWDRAVGPMQFIPSTWSVVGVDADSDGIRNPQDIDDAALAAAVYLCSGDDDLSTLEGQKAAVYRYNNSTAYVDLVLEIMEQYLDGNYTSVAGTTTAGGYVVPDPTYDPPPAYNPPKGNGLSNSGNSGNNGGSTPPATTPSSPPPGNNGGDPGGENGDPDGKEKDPGKQVEDAINELPETVDKTVEEVTETVDNVLSEPQAALQCLGVLPAATAEGLAGLAPNVIRGLLQLTPNLLNSFNECVDQKTS